MKLYKPSLTIGRGRGINNGRSIVRRCNKAATIYIANRDAVQNGSIPEYITDTLRKEFYKLLQGTGLTVTDYDEKPIETYEHSTILWDGLLENNESVLVRMIFRMKKETAIRLAGESKGGYLIPLNISSELAERMRGEA